ncbi:hypothetical protein [Kutzneria sp. CA-103260]|uniref:hypothetical protein n=1 Tax=Kutzneria sp. CA-103260 TaxID=2802641 RepID=UPI001BA6A592|nr:hypothetical protein [Kutzneria sp. CA-103260]QUQ62531.1 hypothetical protein JJ691_02430 [Kutzneria sp. CA-103260]
MERGEIVAVWAQKIASVWGPLPDTTLDAMPTPHGWCGHVQGTTPQLASAAAGQIAAAYGLPNRSVLVQQTDGGGVFLWAYQTASAADYHRQWPQPVIDGSEFTDVVRTGEGSSLLDYVRLTEMARKHQAEWRDLRSGRPVDIQRFTRRLTLLRAGVFDMLTRSRPIQVRELLVRVGVPAESLPDDVLRAIDYPTATMLTVPRARGVAYTKDSEGTDRIAAP